MEFIDQVSDLKILTNREPRVYLEWTNNEKGRDKHEKYERIIINKNYIVYTNTYNTSKSITYGDVFFNTLEEMYQGLLKNVNIPTDTIQESLIQIASRKIKEYVKSINTEDNQIYKDNELLILSCFGKSLEILESVESPEVTQDKTQ